MQCLKCGNDFDHLYECPLCSEVWRKSGKFNQVVTRIEDFLIALFLTLMVIMVLMQIFMRNFFQSGILGGRFHPSPGIMDRLYRRGNRHAEQISCPD